MSSEYVNPCESSAQAVGEFKFRGETIKKDDMFLSADEWNKVVEHIFNAYNQREDYNASIDDFIVYSNCENNDIIKAGLEYDNEFMSADMFNGVLAKAKYFNEKNSNISTGFGPDYPNLKKMIPDVDVVYAKYFNELEKYVSNMKHPKGSCINCNTGLITCCGCDNCDTSCETACEVSCQSGCQVCQMCTASCDLWPQ